MDCAALMDAIGCDSYAVGGWSDGAIIGLLLTLNRPHNVSKLVIWGGNAYLTTEDIEAYEEDTCSVFLVAAYGASDGANLWRGAASPVDSLV